MGAGLLGAAVVETGLILWRDLSREHSLPPPSDFVSVAIVYGGLSLFPDSASSLASLMGWGFVLATLLNFWSPTSPTKLAVPGGTATVAKGQPTQLQKATPA